MEGWAVTDMSSQKSNHRRLDRIEDIIKSGGKKALGGLAHRLSNRGPWQEYVVIIDEEERDQYLEGLEPGQGPGRVIDIDD